jgi:hypothetical protein
MTSGHREAQILFRQLGEALRYQARATYTREWPTDGVWLHGGFFEPLQGRPIAAVEVVGSEGKKAMNGSVTVLEHVSPLLGIIVVQDEQIRERLSRRKTAEKVETEIERVVEKARDSANASKQRIDVWTMAMLRAHHDRHAGPGRVLAPAQ